MDRNGKNHGQLHLQITYHTMRGIAATRKDLKDAIMFQSRVMVSSQTHTQVQFPICFQVVLASLQLCLYVSRIWKAEIKQGPIC